MAGTRSPSQETTNEAIMVADAVISTAGATPESGAPPYPGDHPPPPPPATIIRNTDVSSIIATATPFTPAADLMQTINKVARVNQELMDWITSTSEHNARLEARNGWLETRNGWLEGCTFLGRQELGRLLDANHRQQLAIDWQIRELANLTNTIRAHEKTISEFHAAQVAFGAAVSGVRAQVNEVGKHVAKAQGGQQGDEGDTEEAALVIEDDEHVIEEDAQAIDDDEHVIAEEERVTEEEVNQHVTARPRKIKLKGPAPPASKRKRVTFEEGEDESVGEPQPRAGKLKRVPRVDKAASAERQSRAVRDPTPEGYARA